MLNELSSLLESHLVSVKEVLVLIEALVREIVVSLALDEITWVIIRLIKVLRWLENLRSIDIRI